MGVIQKKHPGGFRLKPGWYCRSMKNSPRAKAQVLWKMAEHILTADKGQTFPLQLITDKSTRYF